jgi:FAD/FMN-containing dehydrogenase
MLRFNRLLGFDATSGQIVAEAGVLLKDIIDCFLPRGWFPPVTPGTRLVTIGGMVAADVHGKNHHRDGTFGAFVDWLDVLCGDGVTRRCSLDLNADLFICTVGGMGLTGVILRVAFRLRQVETGWIRQVTLPARNLDAVMHLFEENAGATYSVAWIDCLAGGASLGRSVVMLGEHAARCQLPADLRSMPYCPGRRKTLNVPADAPNAMLNRWSVKAFNAAYYRHQMLKRGEQFVNWDSFFYPLDGLANWNRIYGRRGLMQFQCVLPLSGARSGLAALLKAVANCGQGSFLAVLKRLGPASAGALSFPMDGYTLALDFSVTQRSLDLMALLDEIVIEHGGRFYLAKDSRMSAQTLRASDSRIASFRGQRASLTALSFQSSQSERLEL